MVNKKDTVLSGIREIARRAKVSIATVDRVLHKRTGVSAKTKDRINKIIADLDYQPNLMARRLASRKVTRLITLIPKSSEESSFWAAPLKGIEQAETELLQFGVNVVKVFFDQDDIESFNKQTKYILKNKPDGVLLAPSFLEQAKPFLRQCKNLKIPFVFINSDIPGEESLCYIGPNLYKSGYLAANLVSYLVNKTDEILLVHISKEIDNHYHLLRKEEGFRAYFKENHLSIKIIKSDIRPKDNHSVEREIGAILSGNKNLKLIFVTNSRVSSVAGYLKKSGRDILLIGYDYLSENIEFLNEGVINFLICQKPVEQGYRGLMALYRHLVLKDSVEQQYFMPIDIITKENYSFYRN
jgi:LacI family transcriptional regulator